MHNRALMTSHDTLCTLVADCVCRSVAAAQWVEFGLQPSLLSASRCGTERSQCSVALPQRPAGDREREGNGTEGVRGRER